MKFDLVAIGVSAALTLASCNHASEPSRNQIAHVQSDADVMRILKQANGRSSGFTKVEVAALEAGANRGVLTANYALQLHYSMDVDQPREAQSWFDRGVAAGEPNLSVLRAGREELEAAGTKDRDAKRKLLLSEKHHLATALQHSSTLLVAEPATVHEQLREVDARLER